MAAFGDGLVLAEDLTAIVADDADTGEQLSTEEMAERQAEIQRLEEQLAIEVKIKQGAESMLKVYYSFQKSESISKDEVELQLKAAEAKIAALSRQIDELRSASWRGGMSRRRLQRNDTHQKSTSSFRRSASTHNLSVAVTDNPHKRAPSIGSAPQFQRMAADSGFSAKGVAVSLQEILETLRKDLSGIQRIEALSKLAMFLKLTPNFSDYTPLEPIAVQMRAHLADPAREIRASAYRVLRHMLADASLAETLVRLHLDHYIVRSLQRDARIDAEREQALKLVRVWISSPGAVALLPKSIAACIASFVGSEDKLAPICLETLYELALYNMPLLAECGGLRAIFGALAELPSEHMPSVMAVITALLDREETRKYIRSGVDLEVILSAFTDAYARGPNHNFRLIASAHAVVALLKNWTGIIYLCIENKLALRSLVEALLLPYEEMKRVLLDMFFEIFRARAPQWSADFLSALRRTVDYHLISDDQSRDAVLASFTGTTGSREVIVNHYLAVVLIAFIDAGLMDALIELMKDTNKFLQVRATILLGEVISLANQLLPRSYAMRIQSLPRLFELGASFDDEVLRSNATSAIAHLDKLHRVKAQVAPMEEPWRLHFFAKASTSTSRQDRLQKQLSHMRIVMGIQADDQQFGNLTRESQILSEKSFAKWNWDAISELLQGPLLNPRRIEETVNNKLLKRLVTFYLPLSHQFSDIQPGGAQATQYVRVGCQLVQTLLATPEGTRFLAEQDLLAQLVHALEQLDPMSDKSSEELLFSPERMTNTLTGEYFTLIGIFTGVPAGREMLKRFNVYTLFYFLTELKSRDDIAKAIIACLDYRDSGHPRVILSKVLTAGSAKSRAFATEYMRVILRADVDGFCDWGVRLLHAQVYDPSLEVAERALKVLEEACGNSSCLETLVGLRPTYDYLGEMATPVLLRIMSHPKGFEFLSGLNYIDTALEHWRQDGMTRYVELVEQSLSRALSAPVNTGTSSVLAPKAKDKELFETALDDDGSLPPHICGELTTTRAGCAVLQEKGQLDVLVGAVRQGVAAARTPHDILRVKAALWALGHVGSTPLGIAILEEARALPDMVAIAETSPVLSLRGTAFYALGLIARTHAGADLLEENGWEAITASDRSLRGLALPKDSARLLRVAPSEHPGSWASTHPVEQYSAHDEERRWSAVEMEILASIVALSSAVSANAASKNLSKLRAEAPDAFRSLRLYDEAWKLLTHYNYRLGPRRCVVELFERIQFGEAFIAHMDAAAAGEAGRADDAATAADAAAPSEAASSRMTHGRKESGAVDVKPIQQSLEPKTIIVGFAV